VRRRTLLRRTQPFEEPPADGSAATAGIFSTTAFLPARASVARALAPHIHSTLPHIDVRSRDRAWPSPLVLSFIAFVLLPIAIVAVYLFTIAADQYVSEFRFSLNSIDPPRLDPLSLLAGNVSHSPAGSESQIVVQYMTSRAVIDQLDAALDLHRMFSPPEADWWSRLPRPTSIEGLVQY